MFQIHHTLLVVLIISDIVVWWWCWVSSCWHCLVWVWDTGKMREELTPQLAVTCYHLYTLNLEENLLWKVISCVIWRLDAWLMMLWERRVMGGGHLYHVWWSSVDTVQWSALTPVLACSALHTTAPPLHQFHFDLQTSHSWTHEWSTAVVTTSSAVIDWTHLHQCIVFTVSGLPTVFFTSSASCEQCWAVFWVMFVLH